MTNPILDAIHDLALDYAPTSKQQQAIDNPHDQRDTAEEIAEGIYRQVDSYRAVLAADLGVSKDQILPSDVLFRVTMDFQLFGFERYVKDGRAQKPDILYELAPEKAFEIGRRIGQQTAAPVTTLYREVLGREPDAEGLAYWQGVYADGSRLSDIVRAFEQSDEARQ